MFGKNSLASHHQFAGTDEQRAADLQWALDNDQFAAVICSRGGYGSLRILEKLDFSNFIKNPKWLVGFSDITVLHAYINNFLKTKTIHGIMPVNFDSATEHSLESLKNALFGEKNVYKFQKNQLSRHGKAKGEIIGGNLSLIISIAGSHFDYDTTGKILFIEDVNEFLYRIDRLMMNLKIRGKLEKLAGLLVGSFDKMNDNPTPFGMNVYEIIAEKVKNYDFPVAFGFPAGHAKQNLALILGHEVELEVGERHCLLKFY